MGEQRNLEWYFSRNCRNSLKNNIFEFDEKTFKQKRGTAIRSKFAPLYAILFVADFEEKMFENFEKNNNNDLIEVHIDQVKSFHPTIKLTTEYSKEEVNFLDLNTKLIDGELKTDFFC